jgi:hypothetical protein
MSNFDGSMKSNVSMMLHDNCKLAALELHNSCSYIIVIKLQKLHTYTISSMMNYIYCNSCSLFDNIHAHKNTSSCNELQMVIATQKPSCKSPHFFTVEINKQKKQINKMHIWISSINSKRKPMWSCK